MTHARIRQLAVATLAALTTGCSSLPPTQPAKDLTAIAGQWRGTMTLHEGDGKRVLTVRADNNRSESEPTLAPPQGTAADLAPADGTRDEGRR